MAFPSLALLALVAAPQLQESVTGWSDNFDSYALNSTLAGQGGWSEWNNAGSGQTKVVSLASGAIARSDPHSVWVRGSSDTVYDWAANSPGTYTSGQWTFCGFLYKPVNSTGFTMDVPSFWIMLNRYQPNANDNNWSVQVDFSPLTGNYNIDTASTTFSGPCVFDQWVEIRAEIDLSLDSVELFYNGTTTGVSYPWNGGVSGFGTGQSEIGALDLFANGGLNPQSRVYWDDMSLQPGFNGCGVVPCRSDAVSYCTAGVSASGCQAVLSATGTASASAPSGFTLTTSSVEGLKDGIFFQGTNGRQSTPWSTTNSFRCVAPPVQRLGLQNSGGTLGGCDGGFSLDLNAHWTANPITNPGPGAVVQAQVWYRDPGNPGNKSTSLSDAIEFTVCP